jgi:hypothetical protein
MINAFLVETAGDLNPGGHYDAGRVPDIGTDCAFSGTHTPSSQMI